MPILLFGSTSKVLSRKVTTRKGLPVRINKNPAKAGLQFNYLREALMYGARFLSFAMAVWYRRFLLTFVFMERVVIIAEVFIRIAIP